jgi:hypothetical protein
LARTIEQTPSNTRPFRALYYPYSRLLYENDLKRAVLIFDELIFVDPSSYDILSQPAQGPIGGSDNAQARFDLDMSAMSFLQGNLTADEFRHQNRYPYRAKGRGSKQTYASWYDVRKVYQVLRREGAVSLAHSQSLLHPFSDVLCSSILRDLMRSKFTEPVRKSMPRDAYAIIGAPSVSGWQLHTSRISEKLIQFLKDRALLKHGIETILEETNHPNDIEKTVERLTWVAEEVEEGREEMLDDILRTPFEFGLFTVVNQALLLSDILDAHLITDDALPYQLVGQKFSEIRPLRQGVLPRTVNEPAGVKRFRYQQFVTTVVSRVIPNALLELVSIEDVLAFRRDNKNNLEAFRAQMTALANRLTAEVGGDDFDREVDVLVKQEIAPLVRNIDGQLQQSRDKFFRTALSKLGSNVLKASAAAIPTLSLATYFGATPAQLVLYSAAALITGLGLVLPDFVEHIAESRKLRSNGLNYLLDFSKMPQT